ncbi:MAG: dihydrodipicolinate synthase family protein [Candidatus Baldrarchaeia archaeon]
MEGNKKFQGIVPPMLTSFTKEGEIYEKGIRNCVDFLIEHGVHGFWALGSVGMGPYMRIEERKRVAEIIIDQTNGKIPVIVHVGSTATRDCVELAKHAQDIGADAISIVPSYYLPPKFEELKEHYMFVAEKVDIPIFIYNNPSVCGFNITPRQAAELAEIDGIIGIKETAANLAQLYECIKHCKEVKKDFIFLYANSTLATLGLIAGAHGVVPSIANALPELYVKIFENVAQNKLKEALEIQQKIISVESAFRQPRITALYETLKIRGCDVGFPRRPLILEATEDVRQKIKSALKVLGVI